MMISLGGKQVDERTIWYGMVCYGMLWYGRTVQSTGAVPSN